MSFDWIASPDLWIALVSLTAIEIVLGIDNIIFISILSGKLPAAQQRAARRLGLGLAMFMRVGLLCSLSWMMRMTKPLFALLSHDFTVRDLILIGGGLFLLAKSTFEIHEKLEGAGHSSASMKAAVSFAGIIFQILMLDLVFSLDSVITAVGMADQIGVMIAAVVIAVAVMMLLAEPISSFVEAHPTVKVLALSFLLLIGANLVAEGLGQHIPKGYTYFAMAFSVMVETLNLRLRRSRDGHAAGTE